MMLVSIEYFFVKFRNGKRIIVNISMMFLNHNGTPAFLLSNPNLGTISFTNFSHFKSALDQMIKDYIRVFDNPELVIETLVNKKPQLNIIMSDLELPTSQKMKFVTKNTSSLFARVSYRV